MSVGRKVVLSTLVPLTLLGSVLGALAVWAVWRLEGRLAEQSARALIQEEALRIEGFFGARGASVDAMLASRHLREYFAAYRERGRQIDDDAELARIVDTFAGILSTDTTLTSCFFASAFTGEYFDATGRIALAGYDARTRWWWPKTIERGELFVQPPASDADTGQLVVAIKTPVRENGQLIGVAGVDVELETIAQRVGRISSRDTGTAFLVADDGLLVTFPRLDFEKLKTVGEQIKVTLGDIDRHLDDTSGFTDLAPLMESGATGTAEVTLEGEPHLVVFTPVRADHPSLRWSLGMAIPRSVVVAPVRRATLATALALAAAVILVALASLAASRRLVTEPVRRLADRFRDIAEGGGDLTRRLEVSSADELGELAGLFNRFVDQIRGDVAAIAEQARRLETAAARMSGLGDQIDALGRDSSSQTGVISSAAKEVSHSVQSAAAGTAQMTASIHEIASRANEAAEVASEAVGISEASTSRLAELGSSAERIASFVQVIQTIAEQTNLLALNATIEAARAGEAGRGFAVVAGEVKELASQAGKASQEIRGLVGGTRRHSETALTTNRQVASIVEKIHEIQMTIAAAVEEQSVTMAEISQSVSMAAGSSSEIAANLEGIAGLTRAAAETAAAVRRSAAELSATAADLAAVVQRFRH